MLKYCIFPIKGDELIYVRVKSREATLADFTFSRSDIKQRDCGIQYSCKIRNLVQYHDTNSCWHDVELLSPIRRRHQYNCIRPLWSLNIVGSSSSQPALRKFTIWLNVVNSKRTMIKETSEIKLNRIIFYYRSKNLQ